MGKMFFKLNKVHFITGWLALYLIIACNKGNVNMQTIEYNPEPYQLVYPQKWPPPILNTLNPLTTDGIRLGKKLYYDPILSSNGRSCASCHLAERSFSFPLFTKENGHITSVPPHINLAWNPDYNWDGSAPVLDLLPIGDFGPHFFNTNFKDLYQRLSVHTDYPILFKKAFNVDNINGLPQEKLKLKISYAISQFLRTMISFNSRYDKLMRHEINLTSLEMEGFEIFNTEKGDCFHCHGTALLTSNGFYNNGLDLTHTEGSLGLYNVTKNEHDKGKFSAPTLRNIALTAPYMHDGRFKTLEEVIDFYDAGVQQNSPNIDPLMTKSLKRYGLNLSSKDKQALLAFLKCLTDTVFITNPEYRNP